MQSSDGETGAFIKESPCPFAFSASPPNPSARTSRCPKAKLEKIGAIRLVADQPGLPCRVSLTHAAVGDELLLLNYEHQPATTPYRARHAIYVSRASART
jgi:hypothetical protein